jgi:hypothetical protein
MSLVEFDVPIEAHMHVTDLVSHMTTQSLSCRYSCGCYLYILSLQIVQKAKIT